MFFDKSIEDLTFDDISEFCNSHSEGYRVEYKSNFDQNVRRNIPKVVSSFANAHGGILIIGVSTDGNQAITPLTGFIPPENEELRLTIQNLCRTNIYPSIFPKIKEIPTGTGSNILVIVLVDESIETPHAIENSRNVYIRTGDSANPVDLCNINRLKELFNRKTDAHKLREELKNEATSIIRNIGIELLGVTHFKISISPTNPKNAIIGKTELYELCRELRRDTDYEYDELFSVGSLRRIQNGVYAYLPSIKFIYSNIFGFVLSWNYAQNESENIPHVEGNVRVLNFSQFVREIANEIRFSSKLTEYCNWEGNLIINFEIKNITQYSINLFNQRQRGINRSLDSNITTTLEVDTTEISKINPTIIANLLYDLLWSFHQYNANPHYPSILEKVEQVLRASRLID